MDRVLHRGGEPSARRHGTDTGSRTGSVQGGMGDMSAAGAKRLTLKPRRQTDQGPMRAPYPMRRPGPTDDWAFLSFAAPDGGLGPPPAATMKEASRRPQ